MAEHQIKYGIRDIVRKKNFSEMKKDFQEKANRWLEEKGPFACYLPIAQVIKKFEGKARKYDNQDLMLRAKNLWKIVDEWSMGKTSAAWEKYMNSMK